MSDDPTGIEELKQFSDVSLLARVAWAEGRGEPEIGRIAIVNVVMNRVKKKGWMGHDVRSVLTKPYQFSCLLLSDPNRPKLMAITEKDKIYAGCLAIAAEGLAGTLEDVTGGATSYYAKSIPRPKWAANADPLITIGNHVFYGDLDGTGKT